jgi:hypothetical protein
MTQGNIMKSTSKTPYEIRLELLQLAKDILMAKHSVADNWGTENLGDASSFAPKTAPTTEEVIAEAEKLNQFVSKASN